MNGEQKSEQKSVTQNAGIVGIGTTTSRVLGLIRESVIVAYFPKEVVDAFQTAFMIPNVFRRLTAEGSFSISVVSVFSKIWAKGDFEESRRFVKSVTGFSLIFLGMLAVAGVLGAKGLTWLASSGSGGYAEKYELTVRLTGTMFPYIFFVSLTAIAMGVLNSSGRFVAPAFAPVFLNIAMIGCAFGLAGVMPSLGLEPIFGLAIGVLLGGILQVVLQLPSLRSARLLVKPSLEFNNPGLKQVLRLTGPMIIGAAAYSVGIYVNNSLAWTLPHGSVMYINSANRIVELPMAVLVGAISTAALPSLSSLKGQGKMEEMKRTYNETLRLALFIAMPAIAAFVVLAEPIVSVLYQRGEFTYLETQKTAACLRWLSLGLCSVTLLRQTTPAFYALEKVWTPVLMTLVFIVTHISLGYTLKGSFLHEGLCIALSVAATVQAAGLILVLRTKIGKLDFMGTLLSFVRTLAASLVMSAVVFGIGKLGVWEKGGNSPRNIAVLGLAVVLGAAVFFLTALALKAPELNNLTEALKRKRRRGKSKCE